MVEKIEFWVQSRSNFQNFQKNLNKIRKFGIYKKFGQISRKISKHL